MSKPLIVAAPLLAYALFAVVRSLRGRKPSRMALNIEFSLLLLGYSATTVSLGIFWVANQQLPPFDWHYLAGYCTAALIAVHLAFNLRVVLAHYRHRKGGRPGRAKPAVRSGSLWWLGSGLLAIAAFYLGMRAGGTKFVVSSDGEPHAPTTIERFHDFSSHSRSGVALRAPSIGWEISARDRRPAPQELIRLPPRDLDYRRYASLSHALAHEPLPARAQAITLAELSQLLFAAAGVTERRGGLSLRASASSGALFPSEVYVLARDISGLEPGAYSYHPEPHALARVEGGDLDLERAGVAFDGPLALVTTSVFQRTGQKYRDRTYRYVAADAGHALGNLLIAAAELGLSAHLEPRFDEAEVARGLAVDEREEGVMSLVSVQAGAGRAKTTSFASFEEVKVPDPDGLALGVTSLAHLATSLRVAQGVVLDATANAEAVSLPESTPAPETTFRALARRRSVRTFGARALELAALSSILRYAAGVPPELSHAVRTHLVTGEVTGLEPGVYEYDASARRLLLRRRGELVAAAGRAALDQEVIAGAHTVFVLTLDRRVLDREGPRGYRHAFIEAGLIGARLYLEAVGRGLGACSVGAFYDRETAELLGVDLEQQWPIHFAALGTLP
jgi:SagB-type dehydrogenase family enzyme